MFEFFLKYPRIAFDQGELILAREWSPWLAAIMLLVFGLLIMFMLVRARKSMATAGLLTIGLLQLAMLAVVLLMIWQPAILTERLRGGDNVIALMLDTSASMNYTDTGTSRMQDALAVLDNNVFDELQGRYDVQRFLFAAKADSVDSFDNLPPPQPVTLLGDSLQQVLGMSRSSPLGAIVLVSDGADNSGALTRDQLAEIASYNVPVHTIAIGREAIDEDLELQDVTLPGQALPGTIMSARVAIRHDQPGIATLKVYDNDSLLMTSNIELEAATDVTTSLVDIPVSDTGYRHLRFTLDGWPDEQVTENNTRSRVVEVKQERYRVLYIEGEPRWEYKFMRRALDDDPGVDLVSLLRVSQNKFYRQGIKTPDELEQGFPVERSELFRYHAMIIGSIEAASFTPEQQQMIHDFVSERGGSLLMLAGPNGLGAGGWENSPIQEALPARLGENDSTFVREKVKVSLAAAGRHSPILKLSQTPAENRIRWQELPEVADFQGIGPLKPAATVLLEYRYQNAVSPLLVSQPYGRGYSYILATGGTWRWQMSLPLEDQRHETFWRQLLREMVINAPGRFRMSSETVADEIRISMEMRNEDYEPERELKLTAIVTPESGRSMTVELNDSPELPGVMTGKFRAEQSGLYNIETITRRGDEPVDSARMAVYHDAGTAEYYSLRTNRSLLQQLADATGGRNWSVDNLDELLNAIEFSRAGLTEREIRPLWDAPLFFLLLLALKALEWLSRRRWKTI